uniref:Coagulation factor II thrombin receptor n=1 Tax=Salarias fasciatus TaxID=181472 RepID=A0A672FEN7_SALFA
MAPKTCLFLLLCVCSASSAVTSNGSSILRTFVVFPSSVTDEPFDLESIYYDEDIKMNRSAVVQVLNISSNKPGFSEEALLFLTGPVSTIFIPSFYTLVCVISVPINVCAMLAFARGIRPKKPAAIYMLNLATADLLFAVLLPFKIFYHFDGNNWRFGALMCRVVTAAFYWNMYCSVLLIACISVDRLLAVVYPIDSLAWRRPRNAVTACVIMWTVLCWLCAPGRLRADCLPQRPEHHHLPRRAVRRQRGVAEDLLLHLVLRAVLPASARHGGVLLSGDLVAELHLQGGFRKLTQKVEGGGDGSDGAGDVLCFMPTNCLMLAHYLQFDQAVAQSRDPRWVLRSLSGVPVWEA